VTGKSNDNSAVRLPARDPGGHKGTFGTVIVVGGSTGMIGAPALTATAALRSGAGLVKLACPEVVLPHAVMIQPGATGIALGEDPMANLEALEAADPQQTAVLAVGPGLGHDPMAALMLHRLLRGPRAVVLDADGLNLWAASGSVSRPTDAAVCELVLTPHPGEYCRLAAAAELEHDPVDPPQRPVAARALARACRASVVLKGHQSVVSDGERVYVNHTGNVAMATAGSGDVLTGCLAALLAQGMSGFDAAVLATHRHGLAGDLWAGQHGPRGLLAQELADLLPAAFQAE